MRVAPKNATTTAPNAAQCQLFLDNVVAGLRSVRLLNDRQQNGQRKLSNVFAVAIGGKADMPVCTAIVCL
jgi:hypothetical protein